jgi:uncharacterized protein (UPF0332 family)
MTDRETLMAYRLREADETLDDAVKMLEAKTSPRSVVNRAYYSMFYGVLGLFNRFETEHRTSRHSTVIAIFDREFVRTGIIDPRYSRMLHRLFDARQIADYKDLIEPSEEDAVKAVEQAREFLITIRNCSEVSNGVSGAPPL